MNAHMSRFLLALRCFLAVLMRRPLPEAAALSLLPAVTKEPSLPPAKVEAAPEKKPEPPAKEPAKTAPESSAPAAPSAGQAGLTDSERQAACHRGGIALLGILQREGRLLDFLMENIDGYADAQVGAAVRDIHRGCRKALNEHIKPKAIRSEADESVVRVEAGYDASQLRLIGRVTGRPPFEGTLRHHGWRATEIRLSDIPAGHDASVICPAEVEIGA
jgi:hypothetical protein